MAAALVRPDPLGFRIGVDASSEPMLPKNDPGEPLYQRAILDFGDDDVLVIAMESDGRLHAARTSSTLRSVSDEIRKLPGVRGTESLVDVYAYRFDAEARAGRGGPLHRRRSRPIPRRSPTCAGARSPTRSTPRRSSRATAAPRRSTSASRPMTDGEFAELGLDDRIRAILDAATHDGVHFYVTGRPHIRAQAQELLIQRHAAPDSDRGAWWRWSRSG